MIPRGGRRGGDGRFLQLKLILFFVAAGFMMLAIFGGQDWAALVCIGVGAVALLLRFLPRRDEPPPEEDEDAA